MSSPGQARPTAPHDDLEAEGPWSILPIADTFIEQRPSTTARLGMPLVVHDLDGVLLGVDRVTSGAVSVSDQFWRIDVSSTETGITYARAPRPVREEVQRLRDEIVRRTRLTREQIARALGVDRRSLSAWVRGDSTPRRDKLERLQLLADVVKDIDATEPGTATEVLLSRTAGQDLLDYIATGRLAHPRDWHALRGSPSMTIVHHRSAKRPLHQNALDAYLRGELRPLGRATTIRPESDYEQDLSHAERLMPDEPVRRSRRGYR